MTFEIILGIVLTSILSGNYALVHFLGTGAVIENHRTRNRSLALGLGTTLVMVLTTLITWPINHFLLEKVSYLQTFVFVLVVLGVVELLHVIAKNILDNYCRSDFVKFAINGAVLGLCIHNTEHDFLTAIITALSVGIGFMLTFTLFSKLRRRVEDEDVPESFRGLPISLLTAGMIVLALLALNFKF
jgi:electron transport complex protein RnfA